MRWLTFAVVVGAIVLSACSSDEGGAGDILEDDDVTVDMFDYR